MNLEKVNIEGSAIRVSMDIGTKLHLKIDGVDLPLQSIFIGMETNEYIIIKAPTPVYKIRHKLFQGNDIIVNYICKGVHTFQTRLIEYIAKPISMLIIEYPKIIQSRDPRTHARMHCFVPSIIKGRNEEGFGAILDISRVGCRWQIKATLEGERMPSFSINEKITLQCQLPGTKEKLIIVGDVKTIKKNKQVINLGILFHKGSREVKNMIAHYILSLEDYFQPTEK